MTKSILFTTALLLCFGTANINAQTYDIIDIPGHSGAAPGFGHNILHDTTPLMSGDHLGYFRLDGTGVNEYNDVTGDFQASINIYANRANTVLIGTAVLSSENLLVAGNGRLSGDMDIDFLTGSASWMSDTTFHYDAVNHIGNGNGPNNLVDTDNDGDGDRIVLWGADGWDDDAGAWPNAALGIDLAFDLRAGDIPDVPEPGTLALLGLGGAALTAVRRRRNKA